MIAISTNIVEESAKLLSVLGRGLSLIHRPSGTIAHKLA